MAAAMDPTRPRRPSAARPAAPSQAWSDTCRRCKSDLRLLREFAARLPEHRDSCLRHLRAGRPAAAAGTPRRCHAIAPDAESRRLLAVCRAPSRRLARRGRPGAGGLTATGVSWVHGLPKRDVERLAFLEATFDPGRLLPPMRPFGLR